MREMITAMGRRNRGEPLGGCRTTLGTFVLWGLIFVAGVIFANPVRELVMRIITPRTQTVVVNAFSGDGARNEAIRAFNFTFPTTASNFFYGRVGDRGQWVRFDISPSQLGGLFRGTTIGCSFTLVDGFTPAFQFASLVPADQQASFGWWAVAGVQRRNGGECVEPAGTRRSVRFLGNTANPALWTVYLEVAG